MNKNVNRDYLVKVNVKTAEIETPKDDMIFYVTDIWTSNIFFQLDFGKGNSLTDLHKENASDYDLTLRVVKPNKEHKEIKASLLSQDSNFFVADLKPDFTDYIGICECELFIETTINGRKETNTTDPFEYIVEGSVFSALDEVIEGRPDYPPLADKLATKEYVDAAVAAGGGGGNIDLSGYVTTEAMNTALAGKSDTTHTHSELHTHSNKDVLDGITAEKIASWDSNTGSGSGDVSSIDLTNLVVTNSISMGREEGTTIGNRSTAVGYNVIASGYYSHAEGFKTTSSGESSHAEGCHTTASYDYSHAEGYYTTASSAYSHSEGNYTTASARSSHAEGERNTASGFYSHAEGYYTTASGRSSHAEGSYTIANGKESYPQHVQGIYNTQDTENKYAHIVGNGTSDTARSNAHTLDWNGNGWYKGNLYVGGTSQDTGKKLATEEYVDNAVANVSSSGSIDLSSYVTTEAMNAALTSKSDIGHSHDELHTHTNKDVLDSITAEKVASWDSCTGDIVDLVVTNSISLGRKSDTVIGTYSTAEGYETTASGHRSHAEGYITVASGDCSHAEGFGTIASSSYQHVQGKYNIEDTAKKYAHIVGNGSEKEIDGTWQIVGANIHTLDWQGNGWYAGDIYVGGTSQDTGKKIATEEYVNNAISAGGGSSSSVDLSGYVTTEAMNTALSGKSNTNHTHSNYATSNNPNFTGTISGNNQFAVGKYVSATGNYSYAQGLGYEYYDDITEVYEEIYVLASGAASHAEGYGTQAKSSCQHVQGKLNIPDTANRYAHIVGNGTDEISKSNAHTLDWDGNGWYAGNLYVGGTNQDNANKVLSTADIKFTSDGKLSVTINGVTKKFNPA